MKQPEKFLEKEDERKEKERKLKVLKQEKLEVLKASITSKLTPEELKVIRFVE